MKHYCSSYAERTVQTGHTGWHASTYLLLGGRWVSQVGTSHLNGLVGTRELRLVH